MQNVPKVRVSEAVVYATMPRVIPRCKQLFFSGFNHLSLLVAHIYAMVRLLPAGHPYLDVRNRGRFGVRHVIAEASRNLKFKKENADQVLVFFAIIAGIVLLLMQFVILFYTLLMPQAHAFSWFDTVDADTDIAYNILDRVFGVPNVFCSIIAPITCTTYSVDTNGPAPGAPPLPLPFHQALHVLFRFYSMGLLLIATLIFMYFVFVVVLETAVTGTPFGNRFQNVWVPVRLIMAVGLLMPINYGLNSGQYITLYTAKFASSFATNGWRTFNTQITNHSIFSSGTLPVAAGEINGMLTGEPYTVLAIPEMPSIKPLVDAMIVVHSCAYLYTRLHSGLDNRTVRDGTMGAISKLNDYTLGMDGSGYYHPVIPFFVKVPTDAMTGTITLAANAGAPVVTGDPNEPLGGALATRERMGITAGGMRVVNTYLAAYGFYYGSDIVLRFGEYGVGRAGEPLYPDETGHVKPLCGEIRIPVLDSRDVGGAEATPSRGGSDHMLRFYYNTTLRLWFDENRLKQFARHYTSIAGDDGGAEARWLCAQPAAFHGANGTNGFPAAAACESNTVNGTFRELMIQDYENQLRIAIREAWGNYIRNGTGRNMRTDILERGWGGAGIWYTKIAEINGGFADSVNAVPYMSLFPSVMEKIRKERQKVERNPNPKNPFRPYFISSGNTEVAVKIEAEEHQDAIGVPMARVAEYLGVGDMKLQDPATFNTGNFLMDVMNGLMGTTGLSNMRKANFHMHPLAQLSMVGKGLLEAAIRNFALSTGLMFASPLVKAAGEEKAAGLMTAMAAVLTSTSTMALTAGFVLFYVMPFLPFLYFFFAVGSWVKAIFEAMVGVPLWALAHLRIDGEGLPGDAASNGYFLLLEIFIRPILTVVGLLAAIIVFSAQVRVLNLIWDLVAHNLGGATVGSDILGMVYANEPIYGRSTIDQFFLMIIYVIVVYMLGLASFKLIDRIPDNILRWAGAGVSSFGDIEQDNVEGLNRYVSMGGMTIGTQLMDATQTTASKLGQALPEIMGGSRSGSGTGRPSGSGSGSGTST